MAVHSFLEEYDFSGKTVIPFSTHGTGGMANTIEDMTASLPDSAVVLESIGISCSEVEGAPVTDGSSGPASLFTRLSPYTEKNTVEFLLKAIGKSRTEAFI